MTTAPDYRLARDLGSATLHEAAGRIGSLPSTILPVGAGMRVAGPAFVVHSAPGDNLWLHRAIYRAAPGDVIVAATGDAVPRWGYWGEIMSEAARARALAGLVLEGGSRDSDRLIELAFPVLSLGRCIRGTTKVPSARGSLGEPIRIGEVTIAAGDLIAGDADGVVVIPRARSVDVIRAGLSRVDKEREVVRRIRAGETTLDLLQLGG